MPTIDISYEERTVLLIALEHMRHYERSKPADLQVIWKEPLQSITQKISRTECQPGGCEYCNADAAREESEWRDSYGD